MKPIILLLFLCLSLPAKDVTSAWFADGKFFEESESQRMTNDFGGRLDFTDDSDFLQNWRTQWKSISNIKHLKSVGIVLFVACKYEAEAQDSVYDITIKRPDGSNCICFTNLVAAKQHFYPATGSHDLKPTVRLSPRFTIFRTDPQDPIGTYTVEVELRDRLRKVSLKLKKQLFVVE